MADEDRQVKITIVGKNATGPEIEQVRQALGQVRTATENVNTSSAALQRTYGSLYTASAKLADANKQVYTDLGKVNSLATQFGGGPALRSAEEYAAAVSKIGGASKLTASEQTQVNRVVTEAIAKYRALGQEAPGHLVSLQKATAGATTTTGGLLSSIKSVGAGILAAFSVQAIGSNLLSFTKGVFDAADNVKDLSERMGVGIERSQQFGTAARQTGADVETVSTGIGKMNKNISEGSDQTITTLRGIGLSVSQLRNMKPEDAFLAITDAIQKIPNPMDQSRVAVELFGKAGEKLLPGIREGFRGLADGAAAMSKDTVESLADAKQAWEDFLNTLTIKTGNFIGDTMKRMAATPQQMRNAITSAQLEALRNGDLGFTGTVEIDKYYDAALSRILNRKDIALTGGPSKPGGGEDETAADAKKAADDKKKRLEQILKMESDYYEFRDKRMLSSYDFERTQIDRWVADQKRGFQGSLAQMQQYYAAVDALAAERRSQVALNQALGDAFTNQADMTRGGQGLNGSLNPWVEIGIPAQLRGSRASLRAPPPDYGGMLRDAFNNQRDMTNGGQGMNPRQSVTQSLFGMSGAQFSSSLSKTITGAAMGGGDIGKSVGAQIGGQLGTQLGSEVAKKLGGAAVGKMIGGIAGTFLGPLGSIAGAWLGGKVAGLIGGGEGKKTNDLRDSLKAKYGDAGGDGMAAVVGQFNGLASVQDAYEKFMKGGSQKDVQKAFDDMQAAMNSAQATASKYGLSLDDLKSPQDRLSSATKNLSKDMDELKGMGFSNTQMAKGMGTELNNLVRSALDAGGKIPASFEPLLEELVKGGGLADDLADRLLGIPAKNKVPWQEMQQAAEDLGVDITQLGGQFDQAKWSSVVADAADKFNLLATNGTSASVIVAGIETNTNGVKDAILNLVRSSIALGVEVPANARPMIQAMFDAGQLTDANGDKLKDLGDVKFGKTIAEQFDPLVQALKDLVGVFNKDLPDSLETLRRKAAEGIDVTVREHHESDRSDEQDSDGDGTPDDRDPAPYNPQYYASGGIAEGRQVAVIAERGQREIVGSETFMANALSGAFQRMAGTPAAAAMFGGEPSSTHLVLSIEISGQALDARIKSVTQTSAALGQIQIPRRAVTVQVPRG